MAKAGEDRVSFPHSSFFKTFFILFIYLFFTKYHFSSHFFPYSTGVAHPQVGSGSGREWGYWSKKVQDVGEGSGLSTMRARLGGRAGGRRRTRAKPGHILGRREGPGLGLPKRQEGWLGDVGGRVFPKKKKKKNKNE